MPGLQLHPTRHVATSRSPSLWIHPRTRQIVTDSFSYLREAAYAVGGSARTVSEALPFLDPEISTSTNRVVVIVLSGLQYEAFATSTELQVVCTALRGSREIAALGRIRGRNPIVPGARQRCPRLTRLTAARRRPSSRAS